MNLQFYDSSQTEIFMSYLPSFRLHLCLLLCAFIDMAVLGIGGRVASTILLGQGMDGWTDSRIAVNLKIFVVVLGFCRFLISTYSCFIGKLFLLLLFSSFHFISPFDEGFTFIRNFCYAYLCII